MIINNNNEMTNNIKYKNHDMYIIKNDKIIDKIKETSFNTEKTIYSINEKEINIYDENMNIAERLTLANTSNIKSLRYINNIIEVVEDDKVTLYNTNMEEIKNNTSEIKIYTLDYYGYIINVEDEEELIIKNYDHQEVNKIKGNKIIINNDKIIIDGAIYVIVTK